MLYTLQLYTGTRIGEACGRRFRDWQRDVGPLSALRVHTQYQDRPLKTAKRGDPKERLVPVHPELEQALEAWQASGFEAIYGRPPTEDDFISPDPRNMKARTESQATKAHKRDAEEIGITNHGTHGLRRWMISACRSAGARADVLEAITHNAAGTIIDVYTSWQWPALCEAIDGAELRETPSTHDKVHDISVLLSEIPSDIRQLVVEAVGIEPTSGNVPERRLRA